ncbi:hypothetical protein Salat_2498800 [Sesamum alatum]|uniref:Uncharacterized protein n=1 Tax=Sesamum alatum TaxID=300844 RepID=A0AAE2CC47_9LAMI|nr:hypothetical protein Salat_2498800 [Sesamum alatum]
MNSFEEENLYQMVDDRLHSESATQTPLLPDTSDFLTHHQTKYYILQEIVESGTKAEGDVLGRVMKHLRKKLVDDDGRRGGLKKWVVNKLRKDGYNASLCHSSWPTTLNCPGGEHEYIDITLECKKGSSGLRFDSGHRLQVTVSSWRGDPKLQRPLRRPPDDLRGRRAEAEQHHLHSLR